MKFPFFFAFLCLTCSSLIAQQNVPGYIVNLNKDTVRGFVFISSASEMCRSVKFRRDQNAQWTEYFPSQLAAFGTDLDNYSSMHFTNTASDPVADTAFLRQLVIGVYNLYAYTTSVNNYYLIKSDTAQYFLIKKPYNNGDEIDSKPYYYSYLNLLAISCEKLIPEVDHVAFNDRDLAAFVMKLNNCDSRSQAVSYYHTQKAQWTPIGFMGGWPISSHAQFTANFVVSLSVPRIDKKSSVNFGINYSYSTHPTQEYNNYGDVYTLVTHYNIISFPLTFQYNFTDSRVQPYIYGGFSFALVSNTSNSISYWIPGSRSYTGFYPVAGLGIQARLGSGLFLRADWRYEVILQSPAIGLSYMF